MEAFLQLIANGLVGAIKTSPKDFSRHRKLPLPKLLLFLLFLTAGGKSQGVDGKSGAFFRPRPPQRPVARGRSRPSQRGDQSQSEAVLTAFEQLHHDAVRLAYELWPASEADTWQGLSVFAIDGSKYDLPASQALRAAFNPDSGLDQPGKGHYPQCLVSTVQDVFRRLPIARTIRPIAEANEREELKALLPQIPSGGVLLCDRGYPSYDLIDFVSRHYLGYW